MALSEVWRVVNWEASWNIVSIMIIMIIMIIIIINPGGKLVQLVT